MRKVYLALLALALGGCATSPEITAWNMAREVNTPAAYEDYLRRYPNSGKADEAKELIEKAKAERIKKAGTVAECVAVMNANPDPKTAATVADVAFEAAKKETSPEALYLFLTTFKGHPGAAEIRGRLEQIEFEQASKEESPAAVEYFLYRYPESRFGAEARALLADKTYRTVKAWGSDYGYKGFVARFPDSRHAAEIRGLIRTGAPAAAAPRAGMSLDEAVGKSPSLKKLACALALSEAIRKKPADPDVPRRQLFELEKGAGSGLPQSCASAGLRARPGAEAALAEALDVLAMVEEHRTELARSWEAQKQRSDMVKAAIAASTNVANDLETAELSEDVLGTGPLGRLDVGAEKGSVSARKALDRFQSAEKLVAANKEEIKRLLSETDALYKPLQFYAASFVEAK